MCFFRFSEGEMTSPRIIQTASWPLMTSVQLDSPQDGLSANCPVSDESPENKCHQTEFEAVFFSSLGKLKLISTLLTFTCPENDQLSGNDKQLTNSLWQNLSHKDRNSNAKLHQLVLAWIFCQWFWDKWTAETNAWSTTVANKFTSGINKEEC